ncbi:hypothetical protein [Maribacter sp. 2210JD10-5]|uniref:hypothetical protein n=1 Tax=Maribacter sp. 2210JD10-5 TaxID=3386272 RepID=UPI0039BD407A
MDLLFVDILLGIFLGLAITSFLVMAYLITPVIFNKKKRFKPVKKNQLILPCIRRKSSS